MQAVTDAAGVTVVVLVYVAPKVMTLVVVAYPSLTLVFVGVGSVVVEVRIPDRTVGGGSVIVEEAVRRTVSVVIMAGAVTVAVTETGVS